MNDSSLMHSEFIFNVFFSLNDFVWCSGIQAATLDLQRETSERLWQEGLLRHVPVVGRVVDWWSPPAATGVKGRSLNLRQGTIESTENIYK